MTWFVDNESPPRVLDDDPRQTIICVAAGASSNPDVMRDMHLIAAAPELLVALKDVLRMAKAASLSLGLSQERLAKAEAVIKKAEGQ